MRRTRERTMILWICFYISCHFKALHIALLPWEDRNSMWRYDTGGTVAACLASPVPGFFLLATAPLPHKI